MMTKTSARKGKSIDEIIDGMGTTILESPRVLPASQNLVSETMQQCGEIIHEYKKTEMETFRKFLRLHLTGVLSPAEINIFLQIAEVQIPIHAVQCVNRLIQNSYHAGFNNFKLNAPCPKDYVGAGLAGTLETPLVVQVCGETGNHLGWDANYCQFNLQVTRGLCGYDAQNSQFIIDSAGEYCGARAKHCSFFIRKINATRKMGAEYCSFLTPEKETLNKLQQQVVGQNRIIFINPDGTERLVRDYDDC